jgi:hypothetical protein
MNTLIRTINKNLELEYGDPRLDSEVKSSTEDRGNNVMAMVWLEFNKDGKRIKYRLTSYMEYGKNSLFNVQDGLYRYFVNNLLFATGESRIVDILNGGELHPELIME